MLDALSRILPLVVAVGTVVLAGVMFRLTAINTFIDHRKTSLRNQLRSIIEAAPSLLVVIQRLGKVPSLADDERLLLHSLDEAYGEIAHEVHALRRKAFRWTEALRLGLLSWGCAAAVLFVFQVPIEAKSQAVVLAGLVLIGLLLAVFLVGRALQPGADGLASRDEGLKHIDRARERLVVAGVIPAAGVALVAASPQAGVTIGDIWAAQEGMLQSYRLIFGLMQSVLVAAALIALSSISSSTALAVGFLGAVLGVVWQRVCSSRARAVVFVHWLMRRIEQGEKIDHPYIAFREFQERSTFEGKPVEGDARFESLRKTLTGRRMDVQVPLLFVAFWIALAVLSVWRAAT